MAQLQIVLTAVGGANWVVPADCQSIDIVYCTGAGYPGSGGAGSSTGTGGAPGGNGGGGGACAYRQNIPVTPGSVISYYVSATGGPYTYFRDGNTCLAMSGSGINGGFAGSVGDAVIAGNNGGGGGGSPDGSAGGNGGFGGSSGGPWAGGNVGGGAGGGVAGGTAGTGAFGSPYGGGGGGGGGAFGGRGGGSPGSGNSGYQGLIVIYYTPVANPTVTSCAPNNASVLGGTPVTLTGTNFIGVTAVTFGGVPATGVTVVNANTITCITPAHVAGLVAVAVATASGTGAGNVFTYQAVTVLPADAGSYTLTGAAAAFADVVPAAAGAYALTGVPITLFGTLPAGSFALTGHAADFSSVEAAAPGSYALNGVEQSTSLVMQAESAAYVITPADTPLDRSGFDYEFQQGGIGHYLLELERARQLAAITKKVPGLPIDRRTVPRFEPLRTSPIAMPAPAVDMQAQENERMAAAAAAMQAAQKRRRDEEAILLLAC